MEGILGKNKGPSRRGSVGTKVRGAANESPRWLALKNEEELLARRKLFNWGVRANSDEELAFAAE
jgi:hypothetical protein